MANLVTQLTKTTSLNSFNCNLTNSKYELEFIEIEEEAQLIINLKSVALYSNMFASTYLKQVFPPFNQFTTLFDIKTYLQQLINQNNLTLYKSNNTSILLQITDTHNNQHYQHTFTLTTNTNQTILQLQQNILYLSNKLNQLKKNKKQIYPIKKKKF